MTSSKLVYKLIRLKLRNSLREDDFSVKGAVEWYEYALKNGLLELLFREDELVGFIEVVRMNYIPKSLENLHVYSDSILTGSVAFVVNVCARNMKDLLKLKTRAIKKHIDCEYFVWHSKKDGEFMTYKNIRRKHALSLS